MKTPVKNLTWREVVFFLPVMALVILFLIPEQIYLQDLSDWTYQGWLLAKYLSGDAISQYTLKPYPVPNALITVLLGLLGLVMPILWAEKVLVAAALFCWSALIYRLAARNGTIDLAYGLLCFALFAVASNFWNGYLNFNISGLLWCLFLSMERDNRSAPAKILLFSVALFFCHAITYAFFVVYVICKYSLRWAIWLVPSLLLLLGYIAGRYVLGGNAENIILADPIAGGGAAKWISYKVYTVLKLGFFQNYLLRDGQSLLENRASIYWLLALFSAVALAAGLLQIVRAQVRRWPLLGKEKVFLLGAPIALLVLPSELLGVVNPAERVLFLYLIYGLVHWRWPARLTTYWKGASIAVTSAFLYYNIAVLVDINVLGRYEVGANTPIESSNAIFGATRLPYFSHSLFSHGEKINSIKSDRQDVIVFSSGIWMNREKK